jgi:hypothetical protein
VVPHRGDVTPWRIHVVEEEPRRCHIVEVPHHRGATLGRRRTRAIIASWRSHVMEVSHRGGAALGRRRTHAAITPWRSRAQEEDLRRHHAVEEPHHGEGGLMPPPRRGGGPMLWTRSPSPWCRITVEDPEGDEMPLHTEGRPSETLLAHCCFSEREERAKNRDRKRYLLCSMREKRNRRTQQRIFWNLCWSAPVTARVLNFCAGCLRRSLQKIDLYFYRPS